MPNPKPIVINVWNNISIENIIIYCCRVSSAAECCSITNTLPLPPTAFTGEKPWFPFFSPITSNGTSIRYCGPLVCPTDCLFVVCSSSRAPHSLTIWEIILILFLYLNLEQSCLKSSSILESTIPRIWTKRKSCQRKHSASSKGKSTHSSNICLRNRTGTFNAINKKNE